MSRIAEFSMKEVINSDKYCMNALKKEIDYLTAFDVDRLLAGFRETAGLDCKGAKRYEGWESMLIGGHTLGHFMSAVAQAYINPGVYCEQKKEMYSMLCELTDGLLECQINSKGKENFLFGAAILDPDNVEVQFDNIEINKTDIIHEAWVPWYTLHKILAGVLDTYTLCGYEPALEVARRIGDWSYNRAMGWDEKTAAQVISVEYGGMNEVLYELYSITDDERYAVVAHMFDSVELYEKVASGEANVLNNHHANTTIPKFIGALHRYSTCHGRTIAGEKVDATAYLQYAQNFWKMVYDRHTYVTGGNSEWEHFGEDYILDKERTNCNCETCNVYNMLKLSRSLFEITGDVQYADYYENAFFNTILSSQNPETGMTTYFQPMATGFFKVFGRRFDRFWCCIGTGMENFTKLNDSIYFHTEDRIYVNMYINSKLVWLEKGYTIEMNADLMTSDKVVLRVSCYDGQPVNSEIALRIPQWVQGKPIIKINGSQTEYVYENRYAVIPAGQAGGSEIELTLPMQVRAHVHKDNDRCVAFTYGPFVLSADLGTDNMDTDTTGVMVTIPKEKVEQWDSIVMPKGKSAAELIEHPELYMKKQEAGDRLLFELSMNGLKFGPHYLRYKERYGIYFEVVE